MSPEALTAPDKSAVGTFDETILRTAQRQFPRTDPKTFTVEQVQGETFLVIHQPAPDHDVMWKVMVNARTLSLLRVDPESHQALPEHTVEEWAIPVPAMAAVPDPQARPLALRDLAEQVRRVLSTARGQLQPVRLVVDEEVARLQGAVSGFDPATARARLTSLVVVALDSAQTFATTLAEAETVLAQERQAAGERAAALAMLRKDGGIEQLGQVHQQEQQDQALRLATAALHEAVNEAHLFTGAFTRAATVLSAAGIKAAALMQVETVSVALARLKVQLAAVRQHALELDPVLVQVSEHYGQPVPRLMWNEPKNPFAGPSLAGW